jgi:hypothetical protein
MDFDEERVCIDALYDYLKRQQYRVDVDEELNDPPDFWITINGEKFAAEVTSIVKNKQYRAYCQRLAEDIKEHATRNGHLNGQYCITIHKEPPIPRPHTPERKELLDRAINYIVSTRTDHAAGEQILSKKGRAEITIGKLSIEHSTVLCRGPIDAKWAIDSQKELANLMCKAIEKKRKKLSKLINNYQAILVLYDAYGFCETDDAKKALSLLQVTGYEWLHSIFWVASFTNRQNELYPENPGRTGCFLFSKEFI